MLVRGDLNGKPVCIGAGCDDLHLLSVSMCGGEECNTLPRTLSVESGQGD